MVPLIKCLIPHAQIDSTEVEDMIGYLISAYKVLPITVSVTIIQWIIGLWEHQLVSRQTINAYYDCYFYMMLKKDRLVRTKFSTFFENAWMKLTQIHSRSKMKWNSRIGTPVSKVLEKYFDRSHQKCE